MGTAAHDIDRVEFEIIFLLMVAFLEKEQRFEVIIKNLTFAVGKFQESIIDFIEIVAVVFITQISQAGTNHMAARAGGHVHGVARKADTFRSQNFVCLAIFEYAVLMDTRAVSKGVGADNGFVRRNGFVTDLGDKGRRSGDIFRNDIGVETIEEFFTKFNRHHDFFK